MSTIKKLLKTKTHKNDGLSVRERIYYTLTDAPDRKVEKMAILLSFIVSHFVESGKIAESELDAMLLEISR